MTDAEEHTWTYGYDKGGAQVSQTDANDHTTNWTYDKHGRKLTRTLPMGQTETFHYDIAGNMFKHDRFDHEEFVNDSVMMYDFDGSGREVGRFDPEISTSTVTTAYDLAGQRIRVDDNLGTTRYEYDLRGRLTAEIKFSGEALVYEYDQQGNQTRSLVYSDDSRTTELMETVKTYDRLNRLDTVASDPGTWTYQYNEVGSRAAQINPNGTRTDYEYDDLNRLRKIHTYKDNTSPTPDVDINVFEYTLDNVGNRIHVYEYQNTGTSIVEATLDYVYDDTYKLMREERTDEISHDQVYLREYDYDPVGNRLLQRTSVEGIVQEERTYPAETAYDANDRLLEERLDDEIVTIYEYDGRGNTTAKIDEVNAGESVFYTWDHRDRLVRADRGETIDEITLVAAYAYDASGMRVHKSVGPASADKVNYLIDYRNGTGYSQVARETNGAGEAFVSYRYGDDLLSQVRLDVPGSLGSPRTSMYHYDGLGSTRALTVSDAGVVGSYSFYSFGEAFAASETVRGDFLFVGEQFDVSTGLYNIRARHYDPSCGRFYGLDSHNGSSQRPFSLHKYAYANANPLRYIDPTGHFSAEASVADGVMDLFNEATPSTTWPGLRPGTAGPDITQALVDHFNMYIEQSEQDVARFIPTWFDHIQENYATPNANGSFWQALLANRGFKLQAGTTGAGTVTLGNMVISAYHIRHILIIGYLCPASNAVLTREAMQFHESVLLSILDGGAYYRANAPIFPDSEIEADLLFNEVCIDIAMKMKHARRNNGATDYLTVSEIQGVVQRVSRGGRATIAKKDARAFPAENRVPYTSALPNTMYKLSTPAGLRVPPIDLMR